MSDEPLLGLKLIYSEYSLDRSGQNHGSISLDYDGDLAVVRFTNIHPTGVFTQVEMPLTCAETLMRILKVIHPEMHTIECTFATVPGWRRSFRFSTCENGHTWNMHPVDKVCNIMEKYSYNLRVMLYSLASQINKCGMNDLDKIVAEALNNPFLIDPDKTTEE